MPEKIPEVHTVKVFGSIHKEKLVEVTITSANPYHLVTVAGQVIRAVRDEGYTPETMIVKEAQK